ncbi:ABC transporter permease [Clavibacter nebraskensis]|uniref:Peptide ABC exporter, permease component n=2 Tax=Clavibacter nebraskensis TaxID=31963 RepID=A0AAI8ZJQ6_9MICO|nr:ABC transporter permease [Clavibacter nebraskensis]KXU19822.1 ABC transporter substrate-binding protein [Clavibacter nebraskensis]OAH17878.1 ABC transporter substrate-binding protein [Clavibacter nebraskensis]QGV67741.1 ABC transporter permease [Clavibacter nebraskensis]QGV70541.1 ABC transporter permease [Clavibacter nebraskensis]QGV73332.1 ABC transporter permease [Clavibacter nebraskensis]
MFVAWRDLRFARGRFVLIGAVVALITLLVGFLAGLTGGLAAQDVSAVLALPGDRLVLAQPDSGQPSFAQSSLDDATVAAWRGTAGVTAVTPVGIAQGRATVSGADADAVAVALFGVPHGAPASTVTALAPTADDEVGLSSEAAHALHAAVGDRITIAGAAYDVASVGGDASYSHTPVVALTPAAWADADRRLGGDGDATVLAVSGSPDWAAAASATRTSASPALASLGALETFKSEIGSLALMIAMLFGVSALVVGAFFTVWTMQRAGDVAVLKALGASDASLIRDALGQALVVLVLGIGVGMAAVVGLGSLAGGALPFLLSPLTTLLPAAAMAVLGLAGAAVALRTVTHADPLTALGSNR